MNKSQLVENLSLSSGLQHDRSEELVDLFFDSVSETLSQGGRVEIRGFGAFAVKEYGSYVGRNPKTGEKIVVEPKKLPVWRTGLSLRKRVDTSAEEV